MPQLRPSFLERELPRIRPRLSFRWGRMITATKTIVTRRATPTQDKSMIEKILSLTAETWNDIFQALSVIAALIAFAALVGTALTGRKVGQRQAEKILALDKEVADAKRKQAEAELALSGRLERQELPRAAFMVRLSDFIKGKPVGAAEVIYVPEDDEALSLAITVDGQLRFSGWRITREPSPINPSDPTHILSRYSDEEMKGMPPLPLAIRAGARKGILTVAHAPGAGPFKEGTPARVLFEGFNGVHFAAQWEPDPRLPSDALRIVIGPKL